MRYIVEDWFREEIIIEFNSEEQREAWIKANVNNEGLYQGNRISIYESEEYYDIDDLEQGYPETVYMYM